MHRWIHSMRWPYFSIIFDPPLSVVYRDAFERFALVHFVSHVYFSELVDCDIVILVWVKIDLVLQYILSSGWLVVHDQRIARNWSSVIPRKLRGPRKVVHPCSSIGCTYSSFILKFVLNVISFCTVVASGGSGCLSSTYWDSSKILTVSRHHFFERHGLSIGILVNWIILEI